MRWAILDTGVYIDHWERGDGDSELERMRARFVVRHSAVVLSELRRGAGTAAARERVQSPGRLAATPWTPLWRDWWEAGALVRQIGDANHWDTNKRRAFQNDTLFALTARRGGATVVTTDPDFRFLERALHARVELLSVAS